ncbi:hypothetical protein JR316_0004392 [Psilocybe cubensis]|uniref:Uncharacterized protein n=2 Tax=Psilocybe cubensis TaxID=181762 RepID=A0ACB8H3K5_PSICU|nr:hypothetical protein JR316_0004392 [Psilocybe cubensis]KAH9482294.1 hypothetical protein JR316_0004392 [Psilocybe cubensis]
MSQYIDRKEAMKSYRPKAGTMSPGLKRAREPYRVKNAILGLFLAAFSVGVWAYSISAVKQDVFDDIDEEADALGATGTGTGLGVAVLAKATEGKHAGAGAGAGAGTSTSVDANANASVNVTGTASPTFAASHATSPLPNPAASTVLSEVSKSKSKGLLTHLDSRLPWLLDPQSKTLVWGAPPVDNVGKMVWRSS